MNALSNRQLMIFFNGLGIGIGFASLISSLIWAKLHHRAMDLFVQSKSEFDELYEFTQVALNAINKYSEVVDEDTNRDILTDLKFVAMTSDLSELFDLDDLGEEDEG